ncbi:4Fe-4S dicluster domain-containing protein [Anoxynatronum sibiricum]|uniref:4Fe-4S dicluster domain-containing protein n=1 Tax=Anoxynatronum sibiricum TaxID=210623 RepID=A0ABU9VRU2_9CLOT
MRFPEKTASSSQREDVKHMTGKEVKDCYQCMKCSAGCPMAAHMDRLPHEMMQLAKLGLLEEIYASKSLWICASCMACSSRCPRDLEPASVMESFRVTLLRETPNREETCDGDLTVPRQAMIASMRKHRR